MAARSGTGALVPSIQAAPSAGAVQLVYQLTNAGAAAVDLGGDLSGAAEVQIVAADQREVWRGEARASQDGAWTGRIEPGATRAFVLVWRPGPAERGEYTATVRHRSAGVAVSTRFRFP